jgi:hypothetical protein
MKRTLGIISAMILLSLLAACQTTMRAAAPGHPATKFAVTAGQSMIRTEVLGFSPIAEIGRTSINFALLFANPDAVKSWKVTMGSNKGVQRSFTGIGSRLPSNISWDGRKASGEIAPEGNYTATLAVDYGKAYKAGSAKSTPFILDSTRPTGKIAISPAVFSPTEPTDTVTLTISGAKALSRIESWTMDIYDPGWNLFRSYSGKWPSNSIAWDGKGLNGDLVVSAEDYPVIVRFRDEFGNVGVAQSTVPIDLLVTKVGNGYRIDNSRVYFQDFTADYVNVPEDLAKQNVIRLDQLAEKLKKFPDYKIKIVGHAVMVHWDDKDLGKIEQDTVLVPLSLARADAIKQAVVDRGVNGAMITTEGAGASDPMVPDSEFSNRWRNRRTVIYLMN